MIMMMTMMVVMMMMMDVNEVRQQTASCLPSLHISASPSKLGKMVSSGLWRPVSNPRRSATRSNAEKENLSPQHEGQCEEGIVFQDLGPPGKVPINSKSLLNLTANPGNVSNIFLHLSDMFAKEC